MEMTDAAEDFIFVLTERIERYDNWLETERDPIRRAMWVGWRDATQEALWNFQSRREDMEKGTLVPEREEPFSSYSEKAAA